MEDLDLKELFDMFWTRRLYIFLIVLIFVMIGVFYSLYMVTPKYKASTTLVLAKIESGNVQDASITQTEVTLNQKLISTYSELVKSKAVLGQVIQNLGLDINEEYLRKNVTVSSVKNTELMQITVTHENNNYVDKIANEIAKVFKEKVAEGMYSINNVHVVDEAEETTIPYNVNHIKDVAIFVAIGMVFATMYVLVANMMDNTVKSSEDIEKRIELTVLATVPKYSVKSSNNGGSK